MSQQITIEVSDEVARQAARVAERSSRPIEDVLADWLESVINEMPVEALSDSEILALSKLTLSDEEQSILSDLLARNREGRLDLEQKGQLDELMRIYEHGLLRKSQALRVAVQRGLREPLQA